MDLTDLIITYGYPLIFLGSIFEGEAIVVLGGLVAYAGILKFQFIILFAFLGAVFGDFCWFMIGRKSGTSIFKKWPWFAKITKRPQELVNKKPELLAFFLRFMYGFRNVVPLSLGMSSIKTSTFLFFNSLGALAWVTVVSVIGYFFGNLLRVFLGNIRHREFVIVIVAVLVFSLILGTIRLVNLILRKFNHSK